MQFFLLLFSSHGGNSKCVGKYRPRRIQRWLKLRIATLWGRARPFWIVKKMEDDFQGISSVIWIFKTKFPHKWNEISMKTTRASFCRTETIKYSKNALFSKGFDNNKEKICRMFWAHVKNIENKAKLVQSVHFSAKNLQFVPWKACQEQLISGHDECLMIWSFP